MTVCKFWRQGNCKFGDNCKFEHPRDAAPQARQDQNRFGALGRGGQSYQPQNFRGGPQPRDARDGRNARDPYGVTAKVIEEDLRKERPIWILSGYGPGKDPDIQLFGGFPLEQSQEEIRTLHYQAIASGSVQQSAQMEAELAAKANEQVQAVLNDIDGALQYLATGRNQHPNRNDICKEGTSTLQRNGNGPFSRSSRQNQQRSAFQQQQQQQTQVQQGFGQPPPALPNTTFGATNLAPSSGFGGANQPLGFGGQPQPNQFGQSGPGTFGNQVPATGFGVPAVPPNNPQFGQNNPGFGQQPNGNAPFIQPQQQPAVGPFDQQAMQQQTVGAFNNMPQQAPPQVPNQFGAQIGQPFGQPNTGFFGQGQAPPNASAPAVNGFAMPQQPQQQQQQQQQPAGGFGGGLPAANGDVNSYTTRDASNKLLTWKGRSVNYMNGDHPYYQRDDQTWERIWFPDGPPANSANGAAAAAADDYPAAVEEAYGVLKNTGRFKDGFVPDIAPTAEMVRWDL